MAAIIRELVATCDPNHFRPSDWPLLESYARAICLEQQAYRNLDADGPVFEGRASSWITVAEKCGRQIVALSMR